MERQAPQPAPGSPESLGEPPLRQFRLVFQDRALEADPNHSLQILQLKGLVAAFNIYSIHTRDFETRVSQIDDQVKFTDESVKLGDTLNNTASTYDIIRNSPRGITRAIHMNYLMSQPRNLLGSTERDNEERIITNYPENTQFIDITIEDAEKLQGVVSNLSSINHDSKNIITSIKGFADLLKRYANRPDQRDKLTGSVMRGFASLNRYIEDIAPIQFNNIYLQEELSALDFRGTIDAIMIPQLKDSDYMKDTQVEDASLIVNEHAIAYINLLKAGIVIDTSGRSEEEELLIEEIDQINNRFNQNQRKELEMQISPSLMTHFRFIWSKAFMAQVVDNAAKNLPKTFRNKDKLADDLSLTDVLDEQKRVKALIKILPGEIQLITADNGAGVSDKIEKEGIQKGVSEWDQEGEIEGSGEGLYAFKVKIKSEKYKGELELKSVRKPFMFLEDEEIKQGGQLIITLPLLKPRRYIEPEEKAHLEQGGVIIQLPHLQPESTTEQAA